MGSFVLAAVLGLSGHEHKDSLRQQKTSAKMGFCSCGMSVLTKASCEI